jgi:hypothetical protein
LVRPLGIELVTEGIEACLLLRWLALLVRALFRLLLTALSCLAEPA